MASRSFPRPWPDSAWRGFSAGLLGLYLRIPGMRQNRSLRPTAQGTPLAKDAWLLGIGLSFVLDAVLSRGDDSG